MSNVVAMDPGRRIMGYWRANDVPRLTPRQRRRVVHKQNHAIAPFSKKAE